MIKWSALLLMGISSTVYADLSAIQQEDSQYYYCDTVDCKKRTIKQLATVKSPAPIIKPVELTVYFKLGSSRVNKKSRSLILNTITGKSFQRILVIGHTDLIGTRQVNETLAQSRAKSVSDVLIDLGVAPESIVTRSRCCIQDPKVEPEYRRVLIWLYPRQEGGVLPDLY